MTTIASVWTNAQFFDGAGIKGLRWACGSPPATCPTSLIWRPADTAVMIQDGLNSTQTPTMANFATLCQHHGRLHNAA